MSARPWLKIVGSGLAILVLIGLGTAELIRSARVSDTDRAMAASPVVTVELSTVTPAIAADYHYAADHLTHFGQIPCYCGCDHSLVQPEQSTGLTFELSMHPGMDGAHDMTLHVPVQYADGTKATLNLAVTGDFRD